MTPPKQLPRGRTWESMKTEFYEAIELFLDCWNAPIPHIAVENPRMHDIATKHLSLSGVGKPQIVHPYYFGDPVYKATGWYLKNLPPLKSTNQLLEPARGSDEWKSWNKIWRMSPSENRGQLRSEFFPGMAQAMADQWGDIL